jgi:hypothetical protein
MIDPSLLERAFALSDEVQKAQLGADGPDLAKLAKFAERATTTKPPSLPDDKLAFDLMKRAIALREQANEPTKDERLTSREAVTEMLRGATKPLRVFDKAELAVERKE